MAQHDFTALYAQYPTTIAQMPALFTSHEFILRLAQSNQLEYVEALYTYRNSTHSNSPAPFMAVHGVLSNNLYNCPSLVTHIGSIASVDIFGQPNGCANWQKVTP